jgi:hypothetical protein
MIPAKRDFLGQAFAQTRRAADAPEVTVMAEMKRAYGSGNPARTHALQARLQSGQGVWTAPVRT